MRQSEMKDAERLVQLSNEVSRIAGTLARLSPEPLPTAGPFGSEAAPDVQPNVVRAVIAARRARERHFPEELFADPAWDMLLDLFLAELSQHRVTVSSLCAASAVPATTALRWMKTMVDRGMFIRREDPHDARRVFMELAPDTSAALRRYFSQVTPVAGM